MHQDIAYLVARARLDDLYRVAAEARLAGLTRARAPHRWRLRLRAILSGAAARQRLARPGRIPQQRRPTLRAAPVYAPVRDGERA